MRVAALFDVHGNLPALEAVLAESDVASVDLVLSGRRRRPGPFPRECVEALAAHGDRLAAVHGPAEYFLAQHPPSETAPYFESLAPDS